MRVVLLSSNFAPRCGRGQGLFAEGERVCECCWEVDGGKAGKKEGAHCAVHEARGRDTRDGVGSGEGREGGMGFEDWRDRGAYAAEGKVVRY